MKAFQIYILNNCKRICYCEKETRQVMLFKNEQLPTWKTALCETFIHIIKTQQKFGPELSITLSYQTQQYLIVKLAKIGFGIFEKNETKISKSYQVTVLNFRFLGEKS